VKPWEIIGENLSKAGRLLSVFALNHVRLNIYAYLEEIVNTMTSSQHVYEVRPRRDKRGFDLISWTPS
jgi:hypothetical protein